MENATLAKAVAFMSSSREVALIDDLFQLVLEEIRPFGVTRAHTVSLGRPCTPLSINRFIGSATREWIEHYSLQGFLDRDPVAKKAATCQVPFTWRDVEAESVLANDVDSQTVFHAAREFGMACGLVVPVHSVDGSRCVVTFTGDSLNDDPQSIAYLQIVAIYFHVAAERLATPIAPVANTISLTARQTECLKWVAAGKTDWEIGRILNISEATVNRHIELAKTALDVRSRMQAVLALIADEKFAL
jgi:DNA-binding CsgD family transcriptional regulator